MLKRLFSNTNLFKKAFVFEPGLNIILGKYSSDKDTIGINGIGKSSLIRMIDFLLLSNSTENLFLQTKYDFLRDEKHNVILEILFNGTPFYIQRTFGKGEPIYFGKSLFALEDYSKSELRKVLTNKLFPINEAEVFFKGDRYGTLMDFFIKDDLESLQRVDPLKFSSGTRNQSSKASFNFFLLGLPSKGILNYEELNNEFNQFFETAKGLKNKIKIDQGKSIEEFKSEKIKIEQTIILLENSLKNYNFLENYKNLEKELIETSSQINECLKEYHSKNRKLRKVKESFQRSQEVDTLEIKKLYNEVLSTFGDLVTKTLDEITNFKKEIVENRNKFLITKEQELQKAIDGILTEIAELEQKRSSLYKKLEEKGALESITNTYEQLTIEKTKLAGNLKILEELDGLEEMMGNLNVTVSEVKRDIIATIKERESQINDLRFLFLEILQNAIFLEDDSPNGYFDIAIQSSSSRKRLPFKIEIEIPKADALGQSRLKIVAYDLLVFLRNIKERRVFPHFMIHDGVYHGISLSTKIKALNYMYHQLLASPSYQYFVTFNEDEIYIPKGKETLVGAFDFELEDVVVAEFTDSPEGMLFQRDFK